MNDGGCRAENRKIHFSTLGTPDGRTSNYRGYVRSKPGHAGMVAICVSDRRAVDAPAWGNLACGADMVEGHEGEMRVTIFPRFKAAKETLSLVAFESIRHLHKGSFSYGPMHAQSGPNAIWRSWGMSFSAMAASIAFCLCRAGSSISFNYHNSNPKAKETPCGIYGLPCF